MKPVLVLGFYNRANLGDEMFKETLPKLLPDFHCIFASAEHVINLTAGPYGPISQYQGIICGGGDIFNDYFMRDIQRITQGYSGPIFALGMGIPYPSYLRSGRLQIFDQVFLRETTDLPELTLRIGARYAHFLPDVGFIKTLPSSTLSTLSTSSTSSTLSKPVAQRQIGVFLAQSLSKYPPTIASIVNLIKHIGEQTKIQVRMIRFNTSGESREDDRAVQQMVKEAVGDSVDLINDMEVYTTDELIGIMSTMDFAICSRFHAHIYATIAGCPFISITPTRKVDLYLQEHQLEPLQVKVETSSEMIQVFDRVWPERSQWSSRLTSIAQRNRNLLSTGQVNALLHQAIQKPWLRRPREDWINQPSIDSIYQSSRKLLFKLTGFDLETQSSSNYRISRDQAREVSAHLCFETTRIPGSKYEYGTTENIMTRPWEMKGMIDWIRKDMIQTSLKRFPGFDLDYYDQDTLGGLHRSGWTYVLSYLRMFQNKYGLLCDTYVDRTFLWGNWALQKNGIIPYTSLWFGFIHHTGSTIHSENNAQKLLETKEFQQSLPTCRLLICLSDHLTKWFQDRFKEMDISVPVKTLLHPTLFVEPVWSLESRSLESNQKITLVNIGAWYRNPFSIYQLDLPGVNKKTLRGPHMDDYFPPTQIRLTQNQLTHPDPHGNKWIYYLSIYLTSKYQLAEDYLLVVPNPEDPISLEVERLIHSVEILSQQSDQDYDQLLSESVVFLNLIDTSASNTVIECMVRNTPILVNSHPANQEYLGANYPLFYEDLGQIPTILTEANILRANQYLKEQNKRKLRIETFIEELSRLPPLTQTFQGIELV